MDKCLPDLVELVVEHGAKWLPEDRSEIGDARRSLLKMSADYTVEFVWIMAEYDASRREHLEELIRTPSIRALVREYAERIQKLIARTASGKL